MRKSHEFKYNKNSNNLSQNEFKIKDNNNNELLL